MPCSAKLKACVDDLIAKGKPEANAWAICKASLGETFERHIDFDKIYRQFLNYENGHSRYYNWIQTLGLDESRSYMDNATMREKFNWTRHSALKYHKEDNQAKYWVFESGFPVESMNGNIYDKQELMLSARTLEGKPVNVNHKFLLPTVNIVVSEYDFDDGIVKGVIRVPKELHCPFCKENLTLNDAIEQHFIVNNSLEAECAYSQVGTPHCEGQRFTGLALLTKDTLPGIPLTRLMPLESIMVEALQIANETKKRKIIIKI